MPLRIHNAVTGETRPGEPRDLVQGVWQIKRMNQDPASPQWVLRLTEDLIPLSQQCCGDCQDPSGPDTVDQEGWMWHLGCYQEFL